MFSFSSLLLYSVLFVAKPALATIAITGVTGGVVAATGQRPFRQEFVTFSKTGPAFDLYIQALQQFEAATQTGQTSYYQIAGESFACLNRRSELFSKHEFANFVRSFREEHIVLKGKYMSISISTRQSPYCHHVN